MKQGKTSFVFPHRFDAFSLMNEKVKGANVAYDEEFLHELFTQNGLSVKKQFPGYWTGDTAGSIDFQDVLILKKG